MFRSPFPFGFRPFGITLLTQQRRQDEARARKLTAPLTSSVFIHRKAPAPVRAEGTTKGG